MQSDGFNSALNPVIYEDIALSINTQYNTSMFKFKYSILCLLLMPLSFLCILFIYKLFLSSVSSDITAQNISNSDMTFRGLNLQKQTTKKKQDSAKNSWSRDTKGGGSGSKSQRHSEYGIKPRVVRLL